jgi:hypothetical protein
MIHDKKTGRLRKKSVKAQRAGKKGARKRGHRKLKPATKLKIARALKKTARTGRTAGGRKSLLKRGGGARGRKSHTGKVGRPVGYTCSKATRAKMSASHRARWAKAKRSRKR